jgi:hypothetical protein
MQLQRCRHCQSRFGLVSHRFLFERFCSRTCLGIHKRNLATTIEERVSRWCSDLLTSMAFGKSRTSNESAQRRYLSVPHGAFRAMRRHP